MRESKSYDAWVGFDLAISGEEFLFSDARENQDHVVYYRECYWASAYVSLLSSIACLAVTL
jgi:hypothetical protein